MITQAAKAAAFQRLHDRIGAFIIPNPFDVGGARLLAGIGFEALATTSAGLAFSLGCGDADVTRDATIAHVAAIAAATDLPVSADLRNGFGETPDAVAETIRLVAEAGAVGGSIEDASGDSGQPLYDAGLARERIEAAVGAARACPFPFTLTARAENFLVGSPDLAATIERLQIYQEAGADVLFAPGLVRAEDMATLVRAVDLPVNMLMGLRGDGLGKADLEAIGVRRISIGSALARSAYGAFRRGASEMMESGSFGFADDIPDLSELGAASMDQPSKGEA